ncbi:MAG: hypothetical protein HY774_00575 [Acidobacteria bacterium]|nr:hypothetical protein [Acidobacteriota bacterium]
MPQSGVSPLIQLSAARSPACFTPKLRRDPLLGSRFVVMWLVVGLFSVSLLKLVVQANPHLPPLAPSVAPSSNPQPQFSELLAADNIRFSTFTDQDGLPQNLVHAMAMDHTGRLWVGTQNGVAFYNGRDWRRVSLPDEVNSNIINQNALCATSDQSLWFGTRDSGAARLQNGNWILFNTKNGLAGNNVNCIIPEAGQPKGSGAVWVGTYGGGVSHFDQGKWVTYNTSSGLSSNKVLCLLDSLSPSGQRTLWVGTDGGGLACLRDGKWSTVTTRQGLPDNKVWALLETTDPQGNQVLWVGTETGGLGRYVTGTWTTYRMGSGLPSNSVYSLASTQTASGETVVWAGTLGGGLARFFHETWTVFDTASGLPSNLVRNLMVSSQGTGSSTLWVGTEDGGLSRLESPAWKNVTLPSNLVKNRLQCMLHSQSPSGEPVLWIGTFGDGLLHYSNHSWKVFTETSDLPSNKIRCLLETQDTTGQPVLWVGTNNGLARRQNGTWTTFTTADGLADNVVFCLVETTSGDQKTVWAGTGGGLSRFTGNSWMPVSPGKQSTIGSVRSLLETQTKTGERALWVGTIDGLWCFLNGSWTKRDARTGLKKNYIRSLLEVKLKSSARYLLIGTDGGGILGLDPGSGLSNSTPIKTVVSEQTTPAISGSVIYHLFQRGTSDVYGLTIRGVVRLKIPTLDPKDLSIEEFSSVDGLPGNECNGMAGQVDTTGRIWAATTRGLAVLDPTRQWIDSTRKPLSLERLVISADELNLAQTQYSTSHPLILDYTHNQLKFEIALLCFVREAETRYQTQLVGVDPKPTAWSTDYDREYSNLGAGQYVFRAWGKDYAGNVTGPIEVVFQITPAPWRTWWAFLLYLVIGSGLVVGFVFLRVRTLHLRTLHLKKLVLERTAEVLHQKQQLEITNQSLEVANLELKLLNEMKTEFLGIAAHDLKNPLTIIMTYAELLSIDPNSRRTTVDMAQSIFTSAKRMLGIISSLLDTAALEGKKLKLKKEPASLRALAQFVIDDNRTHAAAKRITIHFEADPNLDWTAEIDEARIQTVFDNLVSNALKYSPQGKEVWIWLEKREEHIVFSVRDEGPGLSPEDQAKLFVKWPGDCERTD